MNAIRVLGIDASMSNFGLVRVNVTLDPLEISGILGMRLISTGAEKTKQVRKNSDDLRRAIDLHSGLHGEAKSCAIGAVEMPVGSQNSRAAASYGMSVGVLASCPIPLIQVTPFEVKLAATGDKNAEKAEMIAWAVARFPDAPWLREERKGAKYGSLLNANEHLADALAAIEAGIQTDQFAQAVAIFHSMAA